MHCHRQVPFRDFKSVGGEAPAAAVAQPAPKRTASLKRTREDLPPAAVAKKASQGAAMSPLPEAVAATAAANANRERGLRWNASIATIKKWEEAQCAEAKLKEQLNR